MKKILFASLLVLALGTFAFAQQGGMGNGMGMGNGNGMGMGMQDGGNNPCPMGNCGGNGQGRGYGYGHGPKHGGYGPNCMQGGAQAEATVKTADEAKAKVQEVIKNDFKGYKITKTEEFVGRGGNKSFRVLTSDASGNEFIFHVNPFGYVKGPWLAQNTQK